MLFTPLALVVAKVVWQVHVNWTDLFRAYISDVWHSDLRLVGWLAADRHGVRQK